MRHGAFDSDATALAERIRSHEKYGSRDLNEWIFSILNPDEGNAVLDLGCGTGKQSIPLAQRVGPNGRVVSVDVSPEVLEALGAQAAELGVDGRIERHCMSLDDLGGRLSGSRFDRVIASYSIYYVDNAERLFATIADLLLAGGILFFCGPSSANNKEIVDFHNRVKGAATGSAGTADLFMEGTGPRLANRFFTGVETHHFENPIRYDSADALMAYWSSYNLYDPAIEGDFRAAAEAHFADHEVLETVKRVIGISARGA